MTSKQPNSYPVYPHDIAPASESQTHADHQFQPHQTPHNQHSEAGRFNTFIEHEYESHVTGTATFISLIRDKYSDAYNQGYVDACKQRDDAALSTNQRFYNPAFGGDAQYQQGQFGYGQSAQHEGISGRNEHSFTDQSYQNQQRSTQRQEYNTDYMRSIDMLLNSTGRFPVDAQQQQQQEYIAYQMQDVQQAQDEYNDDQGFDDYSENIFQKQTSTPEEVPQPVVAPKKKVPKKKASKPAAEKRATSAQHPATEMRGVSLRTIKVVPSIILDSQILQDTVKPLQPEMRGYSQRKPSEGSTLVNQGMGEEITRKRSVGRPRRLVEEGYEETKFRTSSATIDDQVQPRGAGVARVSDAFNGSTLSPTGASPKGKAKAKTVFYQPYPVLPVPSYGLASLEHTSMNSSNTSSSHTSPSTASLPPARLHTIAHTTQPADQRSESRSYQNSVASATTSGASTPNNMPSKSIRDPSIFKQRGQRRAEEAPKFTTVPASRQILPYIPTQVHPQALMAQNFQGRGGSVEGVRESNESRSGSIMPVYSNTQFMASGLVGSQDADPAGYQSLPMNQRSFFREPRVLYNQDYTTPEGYNMNADYILPADPVVDADDQGENRVPGEEVDTRPNVCATCDKSFKRSFNLITHAKTHLNFRPYVCGICKRRQFDLTRHVLTHTDEKDFMCITCNRMFARVDALKRHERKDEKGVMLYCRGLKEAAEPAPAKGKQ